MTRKQSRPTAGRSDGMRDTIDRPAGGTDTTDTVIPHPRLADGTRKILSHRIASKRAKAIAPLRHALVCLRRLAARPASGLSSEQARECELMLLELEALDPSTPPGAEELGAMSARLARLREEIRRRSPGVARPPS